MPKQTRAQETLFDWEYKVDAMGTFEMNDGYEVSDILDKYKRFTGFLQERVTRLVKITQNISPFCDLNIPRDKFPKNWWDTAINIADGNEPKNALPKIINATEEDKRVVYGELIPAYRALKDSFDKRWWFEWIFNHKQYTAERDSIKALKGVMMALTGATEQDIKNQLEEHRDSVRSSGITPEERKAKIRAEKDKRIHEIKRLKVIKWLDENRNDVSLSFGDDLESMADNQIDSEIGNLEWNEIYREIINEPIINEKAKEEIIEDGFIIDDEISEDGEVLEDGEANKSSFEELIDNEKERLIFKNGELDPIDNSFEIQKPIEEDERFIEDIKDLGF